MDTQPRGKGWELEPMELTPGMRAFGLALDAMDKQISGDTLPMNPDLVREHLAYQKHKRAEAAHAQKKFDEEKRAAFDRKLAKQQRRKNRKKERKALMLARPAGMKGLKGTEDPTRHVILDNAKSDFSIARVD